MGNQVCQISTNSKDVEAFFSGRGLCSNWTCKIHSLSGSVWLCVWHVTVAKSLWNVAFCLESSVFTQSPLIGECFFFFLECNKQTVTPWTLNTANCELHMASSLQPYFFPWFHILLLGSSAQTPNTQCIVLENITACLPTFPAFKASRRQVGYLQLRKIKPWNIKLVWQNVPFSFPW